MIDFENTGMIYPLPAEAIALPIFAFLGILSLIVPFTWHYKNRNVGPCSLILFIIMADFFTFINVSIWPTDDYGNWWLGYGLCDIEAKLQYPYMTGVGCATLSITRGLAIAIDVDRAEVLETRGSKRRKVLIDLAICFTLPILQIILHYIIQPNRYYIEPIGGCTASFDNSWPTIVIMFMWPLILSLINCYYICTK
jgi:pheromone a factor receptor